MSPFIFDYDVAKTQREKGEERRGEERREEERRGEDRRGEERRGEERREHREQRTENPEPRTENREHGTERDRQRDRESQRNRETDCCVAEIIIIDDESMIQSCIAVRLFHIKPTRSCILYLSSISSMISC